jgi:phospholipase/carboxylesterase
VPDGEAEVEGGGHSWFPVTRDRSVWESADRRSVGRVVDVVSDIRARFRIDRVFVLGFSQGATLAYMIGLRNPSLVSGVLAISGGMPYIDQEGSIVHALDVAGARNVKLFVARGRSDDLVSAQVFAAQGDYFAARGYAVTSYEFAGAHYLTQELLDQVLRWIREYPRS